MYCWEVHVIIYVSINMYYQYKIAIFQIIYRINLFINNFVLYLLSLINVRQINLILGGRFIKFLELLVRGFFYQFLNGLRIRAEL